MAWKAAAPAVGCAIGSIPHRCSCIAATAAIVSARSGSAFVINALIEADRVALRSGDPQPVAVPTDSGTSAPNLSLPRLSDRGLERIWRPRRLRFVRVGTLDDPAALPPDVHIYTRSKLPWVSLPETTPAFDAYYSAREVWPASSLERRRAIFG